MGGRTKEEAKEEDKELTKKGRNVCRKKELKEKNMEEITKKKKKDEEEKKEQDEAEKKEKDEAEAAALKAKQDNRNAAAMENIAKLKAVKKPGDSSAAPKEDSTKIEDSGNKEESATVKDRKYGRTKEEAKE